MNEQLRQITESFTVALSDRVRQLRSEGVPVIALAAGDPDFHTPEPIINAATQAMLRGATHYSNSRGLPALREAVAARVQRMSGAVYNPEREVLITHGAIHAYHTALHAVLNPGETVLIPDPSWQTHANMVRLLGGEVSAVAGLPENQFLPTMDAWKQALRPRTRALVLNTPGNPTGTVAPRAYLQQVVNFALENDLYIISDEVYDALLYGAEHVSIASFPEAHERTLLVNSLSKTYAMTGWRIGNLCAPAPVIDNALKSSQYTITNVAEFVQHGAIFALTDPAMQQATVAMREAYARRRAAVLAIYDRYGETPIELVEPQGAFYFFIDIRKLGISSNQAAERILNEKHVALVPGSAYGDAGEGFLRLTTAASDEDVSEGFRRLMDWAAAFK